MSWSYRPVNFLELGHLNIYRITWTLVQTGQLIVIGFLSDSQQIQITVVSDAMLIIMQTSLPIGVSSISSIYICLAHPPTSLMRYSSTISVSVYKIKRF